MDGAETYLLAEVQFLRTAYADAIRETATLERFAVLLTAGVWSWCFSNPQNALVPILLWLPAVSIVFLGLRALAQHVYAIRLTARIDRIQETLRVPEEYRWTKLTVLRWSPFRAGTAYAFWAVAQTSTILVPLYVVLPRS
jgi:hypothetical protein